MLNRLKSINITYLVISVCFITIIGIVGSIQFYNSKITTIMGRHVKNYLDNQMHLTYDHLSTQIDSIQNTLTTMGTIVEGNEPAKGFSSDLIAAYSPTLSTSKLSLLYKSSTDLTSTEETLLNAYEENKKILLLSDENGGQTIYILAPITEGNPNKGTVVASYSIKEFYTYFLEPASLDLSTCYLLSSDLRLLYSSNTHENSNFFIDSNQHFSTTKNSLYTQLNSSKPYIERFTSDDIRYIFQYQKLEHSDYYLLRVTAEDDILNTNSTLLNETKALYNNIITIVISLLLFILIIQSLLNIRSNANQSKLALERERYKTLFELSDGVLWEYDIPSDNLTKSDPDLGLQTALATTPNFQNYVLDNRIIYADDIINFQNFFQRLQQGQQNLSCEIRAKDISGEYKWFELNATTIVNNENEPVTILGQTINIDNKKRELEELRFSIERDSLTKLYNQKTAKHKINERISQGSESGVHALLLLDIDQFKEINKTYGHVFGDALLAELANELSNLLNSEGNILSRVGGDEFLFFLTNVPSASYVEKQARQILNVLNEAVRKQGSDTILSGNLGISLIPGDGNDFNSLLDHADTALYYSKIKGHNHYTFYDGSTMTPSRYIKFTEDGSSADLNRQMDRGIIDTTMIANTVEILFDARDLETSFQMILNLIGRFYDLSYIRIIETNEHTFTGHMKYSWKLDTIPNWDENLTVSKADMDQVAGYNKQNNNYFFTSDIREMEAFNSFLYELIKKQATTGFLECGVLENGIPQGYIEYGFHTQDRQWEQHEVDSIQLITKILGGYLNMIRTQETANRLQRVDTLTNANNLTAFHEEAYSLLQDNSSEYILFYSDIDKFKLINDTYGYSEGDRILIEFANAMRAITDEEETFARIYDDKFIGLFKYNNPKHFLSKIKVLNEMMNQIPKTDSDLYRISIIIGLCPIMDNSNISLCMDRANMARKSITNRHKSRYAFFDEEMKSTLVKQQEIEDYMESSLANEEFLVYYQPKVHLADNQICGAEALVRWIHPEKGMIPPNEFIPIFEENHFITKLDLYVFEHVCKHIRKLLDYNQTVYPVSVNFSRLHLDSDQVVNQLRTIVNKYDVPTEFLEIELTETAFQSNDSYMISILTSLHNMGFKISMDDFGSGLSSLNLLRTLPCDILKLDRDFFQQDTSTERERIVITNIVKMARELNMTIVSEGVETEEQAAFLRSIHCDIAQGYLYSKPMPESEYESSYYSLS